MVKEHSHILLEKSMKGNSRMGKEMVKEPTLGLMEENMLGNSRMGKIGTRQDMTKMGTSLERLLME